MHSRSYIFLNNVTLWIYDLGMAEWVERLLVSIHLCCTIQTSSSLWTGQPFASSKFMYSGLSIKDLRASDFFQDWWVEVTHGAKNGGSFSEMMGLSISN